MKILHVVGARPNFIKIAPIMKAMSANPDFFSQVLVHTGQHYDEAMSDIFFKEFELSAPDVNLEVGSGSHAWQTAQVLLRFEPVVSEYQPDWVITVGDVNSTLGCTLVCSKLGFPVAHIEAGLRSFDRNMPEEINRLLTDQIAELLFTPSQDANENLANEGIPAEKIHFVGNVMIDTLVHLLPKAKLKWPRLKDRFKLDRYLLVTLHRPSNVDNHQSLQNILEALEELSKSTAVIFPIHPRTRQRIEEFGLNKLIKGVQLLEPVGYLDFLALQLHARLVLTDSGGVQEETTYLGIPCITARPNTERPITLTLGTNHLVDNTRQELVEKIYAIMEKGSPNAQVPPLWDGKTAERIVGVFQNL
ncbi:MAG: UDP-N-acetylglucosamine 2-epimerase (non-hydrolyzing) [Anaerolineales bacterium]|nr:UDP-N-acetylglucosamine 2-epimerase (non-hydrolyzing) [Anaerolineales bacterium]